MSRRKRRKQTSERRPAHGFPLENLHGGWFDIVFEKLTGKPGPKSGKKQQVAALSELLQNGDRWDEWLSELPALSLIALEILVEARGGLEVEEFESLLQRRSDCDEEAATLASEQLVDRMLVVPLGDSGFGDPEALSLYEGTLALLDERLRGVSLPALPEEFANASDANTSDANLCRTLAVAGLTAHRRLRFTLSGAPDRTALKRFAKNLGASRDEVFALAKRAMNRGWVRAYGENLSPSPERMLDAARGRADDFTLEPWLESWLEPGTWVSLEALVRACVRAHLAAGSVSDPEHGFATVVLDIIPFFYHFEHWLHAAKGLEFRTVEGIDWLRRPIQRVEISGDGHVTANFEVMLGPAAHPEVVACVALGCELQRIDRVLTFRITPESVAQGKAAGLAAGQLRRALDAVGRHPLAENVAQLVDEWEEACSVARVSKGWFLFAGSELQPLLEKGELAPYLLGSPMPGVLELDPAVPRQHIEAALAEHRVRLSLSYPLSDAEAQRECDRLAPRDPFDLDDEWAGELDGEWQEPSFDADERPWTLEPAGAPILRERLALARAAGFGDDLPTGNVESASAGPLPEEIAEQLAMLRQDLAPLERGAARELARFRRKLSAPDRERFELARADGIPLISFLALKPKWRRRIVHVATNLSELVAFADEAAEQGRCTVAGKQLLARLNSPTLTASLGALPEFATPEALYAALEPDRFCDTRSPNPPATQRPTKAPKRQPRGQGSRVGRQPTIPVEFDDEIPAPPCPAIDEFPEFEPHDLLLRLSDLVDHRRSVYVLVESDTGPEVLALGLDRIEIRGHHQVLLAEDLHSGEGRVVYVRTIRSLLL